MKCQKTIRKRSFLGFYANLAVVLWLVAGTLSQAETLDFTEFSIDELMRVQINSVSRKKESLFDAAAAVHVISSEDVKRSGMTTLGESLRMSPGMHVARIDTYNLAVASRGFNDISSNKLLVMADGRTVYSALFSGVQWSDQQITMHDLDRIEVIRGPGASLWGSNAVNGVVNITTKSARDTVGSYSSLLMGNELNYQVDVRHGMDLGNEHYLRVYAKYLQHEPAISDSPAAWMDKPLDQALAGFRYDWEGEERGTLTLQGDFYKADGENSTQNVSLTSPYNFNDLGIQDHEAAYLLARWTQNVWDEGQYSIQAYVDYYSQINSLFGQDQLVLDLDAQLRNHLGEQHELVAGFGLRYLDDELIDGYRYFFDPVSDDRRLFSAFIQDEYTTLSGKLQLVLGAKLEHTVYTGYEFQPNIRALYRPSEDQALWLSVARAARTPSRIERTARIIQQVVPPNPNSPVPIEAIIEADPFFESEYLVAFEAGHRYSSGETFSCDTSIFLNEYTGLRSFEPGGMAFEPTPVPHVVFSNLLRNGIRGSTYGAELTLNLKPVSNIRLQGTLSTIHYNLENEAGSLDAMSIESIVGTSPKTQVGLRAMIDLSEDWMLDIIGHHTSRLSFPDLDPYTALDIRLAWTPRPGLELSLVGRDLLESEHAEFPPTFLGGDLSRISRSFYGRVSWEF